MTINCVNIDPLFAGGSPERDAVDRAVFAAASGIGFLGITGEQRLVPCGKAARSELLRLFTLSGDAKKELWRKKFDAGRTNVYRGYFPLQDGGATYKEGIDMGPDVADPNWRPDPGDPLTEATPLPPEGLLPGWRAAAATYYTNMGNVGAALMRSLARSMDLPETIFDGAFAGGISTLRLIRYPERSERSYVGADPEKVFVEHEGRKRHVIGAAHVDSGFVTLLAQDGVEGLQARAADGRWIDVPPREGTLAVNFGGLLQRWTGGRVKATEHRVLGPGRERFSIPFFYEPRIDAVISPLPNGESFQPFTYGDHLWAAMTRFVEFAGLEHMRSPRGAPAAA